MKKYFFLYILILIIFISSCKNGTVTTHTTVASPTIAHSPSPVVEPDQKPLVLACIPYESELKLLKAWQYLADYLAGQIGIPVKLEIKKSYTPIIDGLKSGDIDLANTGPLIYIKAHDIAGATPLVKPIAIKASAPNYKSYIIVRKDSGIENIAQLKGKKFAFTDKESASGYLMPVLMLSEAGVNNTNFFSEIRYTGDHDSSLSAVYNSYVDAAGISNYIYTKGVDKRLGDLKIIKESDQIPTAPIVARAGMSEELIQKIKKAFLNIDTTKEETKEIIEILKLEGYTEAYDKDYASIRKAQKALETMGLTSE
ncbi:MAG TPA: phosphate/phosphite/phosphonate ABC transporter substrate-binding protein [Candidatus Eremiobacteraeota bacterium]|nr:MAG: Phosphate-import protein PhnD precursor [bacterium ADurb.Bin363]HPZ09411.1 phosphate/phosphite/phosphonate ABC transporter substrate-binding protein [Candidatus Eremiobacteraeota bacterium]